MFSSSVQPPLVSLLSTTSSNCLSLFKSSVDTSLPSDSVICLLNDIGSVPDPPAPAKLISPPSVVLDDENDNAQGRNLNQTVLHIQSPTLRTTYIRCPPSGDHLGLKHPWLHIQVRNLGREWSFEVRVVDRAGRTGTIRCSTFQKEPILKMTTPPLLHLPLSFPAPSTRPLTAWSTLNINLPSLLPHFSSLSLISQEETDSDQESREGPNSRRAITVPVPSGAYSHISYIKIYATCRLRRIWLSEAGPGQVLPVEFDLYGS